MADFMRISEVAERLGVGTRRAYRLAQRGEIPSVRHGGSIRVPRAAWEQYLEAETRKAISALKGGETYAEGGA